MIVDLGILTETDLTYALADFTGLTQIGSEDLPGEPLFSEKISEEFLLRHSFIPIQKNDTDVVLATSNPFNQEIFDGVAYRLDATISLVVCGKTDITSSIRVLYQTDEGDSHQSESLVSGDEHLSKDDIERLRDMAADAPVVSLVNGILTEACQIGASDIHLEPGQKTYRVRFRTNGVLNTHTSRAVVEYAAVSSRIKILAGMDIAERRLPQDGRFRSIVRGTKIDIRVSSVPTQHGESIVLRLLNVGDGVGSLEALGFDADTRVFIERMATRPHGIFLVTGPTGSGKTTTLYSALKLLDADTKKIITVEDPIEYEMDSVNQIQVNSAIGLTFASCLRSILRQDPDIVLIGEIRDSETAEIAVRAALTGHLVLATLHTNDAQSAISRLADMGIEDYLVATTLNGVLAQRLVRTLCEQCKRASSVEEDYLDSLSPSWRNSIIHQSSQIYLANSCEQCVQTGYDARTTISEFLEVDSNNRSVVRRFGAIGDGTVQKSLVEHNIMDSGVAKVLSGLTSLEEILRVTHV